MFTNGHGMKMKQARHCRLSQSIEDNRSKCHLKQRSPDVIRQPGGELGQAVPKCLRTILL